MSTENRPEIESGSATSNIEHDIEAKTAGSTLAHDIVTKAHCPICDEELVASEKAKHIRRKHGE